MTLTVRTVFWWERVMTLTVRIVFWWERVMTLTTCSGFLEPSDIILHLCP